MQVTNGSLVILDAHRDATVFWNGALLPARRVTVVEGRVFLHLVRGSVDPVVLQTLRSEGIHVQEVAA